jgi:hypothetical protein
MGTHHAMTRILDFPLGAIAGLEQGKNKTRVMLPDEKCDNCE